MINKFLILALGLAGCQYTIVCGNSGSQGDTKDLPEDDSPIHTDNYSKDNKGIDQEFMKNIGLDNGINNQFGSELSKHLELSRSISKALEPKAIELNQGSKYLTETSDGYSYRHPVGHGIGLGFDVTKEGNINPALSYNPYADKKPYNFSSVLFSTNSLIGKK